MKGKKRAVIGLALAGLGVAIALGCNQPTAVPDVRVGINEPPPGTVAALSWFPVPGASAYHVVISIDRGLTQPVGVTGFTTERHVTLSAVAWRPGHPQLGRPYFWTMRAYDRPDPQGLLLTNSDPQPITIYNWGQLAGPPLSVAPTVSPSPEPTAAP